jgi:hypothetical protein
MKNTKCEIHYSYGIFQSLVSGAGIENKIYLPAL